MIIFDEDIFDYDKEKMTVIGHGCNCLGAFAAGFAGLVAKKYPLAKVKYKQYVESNTFPDFLAGSTNLVMVEKNLVIANMFTQILPGKHAKISYIMKALDNLTTFFNKDVNIRIPMIGSGIGGLDPEDVLYNLLELVNVPDVYIRSADGHKISDEIVQKHQKFN